MAAIRTLLGSVILLAGCVPHIRTEEAVGPDGEAIYVAHCDGNHNSQADCFNEAARQCDGAGYEVVDTDQSTSAFSSGGHVYTKAHRQMVFRCR